MKRIGISIILAASFTNPVNALPGQRFDTAMKLYKKSSFIENFSDGSTGGGAGSTYSYLAKLRQSENSYFSVYVDKNHQNIILESISLNSLIKLNRNSIENFKEIKNMFSSIVINDFRSSKYIWKRYHNEGTQLSEFYEGKKFNYGVYHSDSQINFAVISKKHDFKAIIFTDSVCYGTFFDCPG